MQPLRHQAWKEVGLVIPQGTLPGAHCDRGGPPTWVGRLALMGHPASAGEQPQLRPTRSDGSPCTAGVAQHMFPPTGRGRPCYAGAMHITHAAPHLPRGVDPAIQGQCTLTTGDRRACKGRQ